MAAGVACSTWADPTELHKFYSSLAIANDRKIVILLIDGLGGLSHLDYGYRTELEYTMHQTLIALLPVVLQECYTRAAGRHAGQLSPAETRLCESENVIDIQERGEIVIFRMEHGKANAFDLGFCEEIVKRLDALRHSVARAIVITGQGRIFSGGVDLLRILDGDSPYIRSFLPALKKAFETLFCFPKPVVAAINGHAIAGGCVLACAADHRLMASESGRIGITELLVGVPFPTLALEMVRHVVAPAHFRTLVYGGATLSPEDAKGAGVVDAVVEPEELLDKAVAVAQSLATIPPDVFTITKRQIRDPVMKQIRDAGEFDAAIDKLWTAPATLEAVRTYVARTFRRSQA